MEIRWNCSFWCRVKKCVEIRRYCSLWCKVKKGLETSWDCSCNLFSKDVCCKAVNLLYHIKGKAHVSFNSFPLKTNIQQTILKTLLQTIEILCKCKHAYQKEVKTLLQKGNLLIMSNISNYFQNKPLKELLKASTSGEGWI